MMVLVAITLAASTASAYEIPPPPAEQAWILDEGEVLTADDRAAIEARQAEVLAATGSQIVVVSVTSLAAHGGSADDIQAFAERWLAAWSPSGDSKAMLLIVSATDRRARIELGAGWAHRADGDARAIMDRMVGAFRAGEYSRGIRVGVDDLADLARTGPTVSAPSDTSAGTVVIVALALTLGIPLVIILVVVIASTRGSGGSSSDSGGSSWDSGSSSSSSSSTSDFGSSGGGATGSW